MDTMLLKKISQQIKSGDWCIIIVSVVDKDESDLQLQQAMSIFVKILCPYYFHSITFWEKKLENNTKL